MDARRLFVPILLAVLVSIAGRPVAAEQVEITPFLGYQFGGDFVTFFDDDHFGGGRLESADLEDSGNYGLMLGFNLNPRMQIELLWSQQETRLEEPRGFAPGFGPAPLDIDLAYYHGGFLYQWETGGQWYPFVVGSLGATSIDPEAGNRDTKFSFALGGGLKLKLTPNFGFRFEGRFYSTQIEEDEVIVCRRDFCYGYDTDTFLNQFDVKAGLILAF